MRATCWPRWPCCWCSVSICCRPCWPACWCTSWCSRWRRCWAGAFPAIARGCVVVAVLGAIVVGLLILLILGAISLLPQRTRQPRAAVATAADAAGGQGAPAVAAGRWSITCPTASTTCAWAAIELAAPACRRSCSWPARTPCAVFVHMHHRPDAGRDHRARPRPPGASGRPAGGGAEPALRSTWPRRSTTSCSRRSRSRCSTRCSPRIFLLGVLPLLGIHVPLAKTLVVVTFVVGLLPVIGNLISNTADRRRRPVGVARRGRRRAGVPDPDPQARILPQRAHRRHADPRPRLGAADRDAG